ncbi:hypothetical protein H5410_017588 [Solanum commersonii]|uniref:Uncharacterized protein n=1 Tax=Solanum commersonii TaxID=4109 RepID=A0A9J6A0T1_SOLCO|nr:hypothetical protein H5410_017588 [Solanum commersonii]
MKLTIAIILLLLYSASIAKTFSPIPTGNLNSVIKKTKMTTTNVVTTSFPISPFVVPAYVNIHA